jgi:hypothetical protein
VFEFPLTPALSPSEGERENRLQSAGETGAVGKFGRELCCSLSPSDGERVRVRGFLDWMVIAGGTYSGAFSALTRFNSFNRRKTTSADIAEATVTTIVAKA